MKHPFPKRLLPPAPAYTLPLSRRAFRKALICGQGRVVLHVQQCGAEGVEDLILEVLTHPPAYDSQCDSRQEQIWSLIQTAGMQMTARVCIQYHIRDTKVNWARHQMFEILALMHQTGDTKALPILAHAALHDIGDSTRNGISWWIEFEAEKAVPALMDFYGKALLEDEDAEIPWLIDSWSDEDKKIKVMEIARRYIAESAAARRFYEATEMETRGAIRADSPKEAAPDAEELIQLAKESPNSYFYPRWINALDEGGLIKIQAALEQEGSPKIREQLMNVFGHRRAPRLVSSWLRWARSREHLGYLTRQALSHFDLASVRRLGLRFLKLKNANRASEGVQMLGAKLSPRAARLIHRRLRGLGIDREVQIHHCSQSWDLHKTHNWGNALCSRVHPSWRSLLLWVWQEAPCKKCRFHAFDALAAIGPLPPEILAEAIHDAGDSTREAAQKLLAGETIELLRT
ncbi:MAG: hypothetical protein RL095_1627 [Verrucomicrobiota bacterium]|jgi:hypothetical protein